MEKYRKCDGCGLTFRDPGNRTWTWTTRDYAGEHYFCSTAVWCIGTGSRRTGRESGDVG